MSAQAAPPPAPPTPAHGGYLHIDLTALAENYRALAGEARPAETAAAVKGDAYGIGLGPAARTLHDSGCRTFFVAHLSEAQALRRLFSPEAAMIYLLNGLLPGTARALAAASARPVLTSLEEIEEWRAFAAANKAPPAAIQIDTGFTRLGLSQRDAEAVKAEPNRLAGIDLALVMSHLACADDPASPMSGEQLARFNAARAAFPGIRASLANSAGIALGAEYRFDMVRPGIGLYGGRATLGGPNPRRPVVSLHVPIIQVRDAPAGATAGYGATYRFAREARIALVSVGYADGFQRAFSASSDSQGATLYLDGHRCPVVGRVSMDVTAIDVTGVPEGRARRGAMVEVIGQHQSVDDLAAAAGTIGYELLTRLGLRHARVYSAP